MNDKLKKRIKDFNECNSKRIILCTLKPLGTVTTAPNKNK
jgi:hypothetical protein